MFTGQREYTKLWTLQCSCLFRPFEGSDHYKQYLFWNLRPIREFVTMFPVVCSGLNVPGKNNPCTGLNRKSGCQAVKPQISKQSAHEGGTFVRPTHRTLLPPVDIPGTHFCQCVCQPQGHSQWKTPTPSGIEVAYFWLVQQSLNQLRHECMWTLSTTFCLEVQ